MSSPLDALRDRLLTMHLDDGLIVTATFDLRPDTQGRINAATVLRQVIGNSDTRTDEGADPEAARSLSDDEAAIEAAIEAATEAGAQGMIYVGAAEKDMRYALTTPLPFRNSAGVGQRPMLAELERYRYLYAHPVLVANVHKDHVELHRVQFGRETATEELSVPRGDVSKGGGRTNRDQSTMTTQGLQGGHTMSKVEHAIEAQQHQFTHEAATELVHLAGDDDLIVVCGPVEPRAKFANEIPDHIRPRVVEIDEPNRGLTDRDIADLAGRLAEKHRYEAGDALARDLLGGAAPELTASGVTGVTEMLTQGRVETLILHDAVAAHFGTTEDIRLHEGHLPAATVEALLRDLAAQSGGLRFACEEKLLEQADGVVARLRW